MVFFIMLKITNWLSDGFKTVIYVDLKKENCRRTEAAVMTALKLKQDALSFSLNFQTE